MQNLNLSPLLVAQEPAHLQAEPKCKVDTPLVAWLVSNSHFKASTVTCFKTSHGIEHHLQVFDVSCSQ